MQPKKIGILAVLTIACLSFAGCNATTAAQKAEQIVGAVLQTAQAEAPAIPVADQAAYNNFVSLGLVLDGQLQSCVSKVGGIMGKGAKFAACFNTFAQGLLAPAELAQLRILSPATQAKVQLYVTAVVAGVNVVVAFTAPQVAAAPASSADLRSLGHRIGLSDADLARAGL